MALSTNSIIHYTKSLESLLGILETGFTVKYCKESLIGKDLIPISYAYPMVCFCDIPLSEAKNHLESYGYYGIGLSKTWARKRGLNPVLYLEQSSILTDSIMQQAGRISINRKQQERGEDVIPIEKIWIDELLSILSHTKNYSGVLNKEGFIHFDYRFYNEREWRYVPKISELAANKPAIQEKVYELNKLEYNEKISSCKLKFNIAEDLSYLIVKEEQDIHNLLDFISNKFKKILTQADIEILMTKIITAEQILNDF